MRRIPLLLVLACLASCRKAPPDPICQIEALPESAGIKSGQGAIQIVSPAEEYFYVYDEGGKQIGSERTGRSYAAKPGAYHVKLNSSSHPVRVQPKMLTRCQAGALMASGQNDQYYYVYDTGGTQLASAKLGKAVALFPGRYDVQINKTSTAAEVKPGATAELKPGNLSVPGKTEEYYYVFDSAGTQLASARLSSPLSLFAGSWTVKVNNSAAKVDIAPGGAAEIRPGVLLAKGSTEEYYYVLDAAGTQLASARLNSGLSLMEGSYFLKLNNVSVPIRIQAGATSEYQSGLLTVKGKGDEYYYVLDSLGTQLASAKLGKSLSLPAGKYQIKQAQETRPVALTEGKETVLNW